MPEFEKQRHTPTRDDQNKKITAFLKTLTGEQPRVDYPNKPEENANTLKSEPIVTN